MSKARTERLLNLLFVLLNSKQPITREQIRIRVPGYEGSSDDAFERMFERDKEALRDLNIPVLTKPVDLFHDDVQGYLIDRDSWLMPEIKLSKEERVLLSLAASAWNSALVSNAANRGLERVSPAELSETPEVTHSMAFGRDWIAELLEAITRQVSVQFTYQSASEKTPAIRSVDPWKLILSGGRWYLVGFDLDRGESRSFRVDRIVNVPLITDQPIIETAPADLDPRELVATWRSIESNSANWATVDVLPGKGAELRLMASEIHHGDEVDTLTIPYLVGIEIARSIVRNSQSVRRIEPKEINDQVSLLISSALEVHQIG